MNNQDMKLRKEYGDIIKEYLEGVNIINIYYKHVWSSHEINLKFIAKVSLRSFSAKIK